MGERKADEMLTEEADTGRVADVHGLSEGQLDEAISRFGWGEEEKQAELRCLLPGAYRDFIMRAKYQINRTEPATDEKVVKPPTAVSRDLNQIGKASRTFRYKSSVKITPPSLSPKTVKWTTFNPPAASSPRRSRARLCHHRSHLSA